MLSCYAMHQYCNWTHCLGSNLTWGLVSRPLTVGERGMMWRFRFSLTGEARALTKFLKCVDWGDAQEACQAGQLMHAWAPIAIADALELLSPDFPSDQVSLLTPTCR